MIDNLVRNRREAAGRPLVATHRGTAAGCIFPNTTAAARLALASGSDVVELDTVRTTDGRYFTFHDGYEPFLLGATPRLGTLSSAEVAGLRYGEINNAGGVSGVEPYAQVVGSLPEALVNVDRSYRYWVNGFLDELADWADPRYMLIKSPVREDYLGALAACSAPFPYMAIVSSAQEVEAVLAHDEDRLVGLELLARSFDDELADPQYVASLRARGLFIWLNAINLEDGQPLYCGWDDMTSVLGDPEDGWGRLVAQGADVIQTDFPWLLRRFLDQRATR